MDIISISLQGWCVACLSSNRNVIPVESNQKKTIMQFLLKYNLKIPLNLCWECSAQLNNICAFQQKAINSMNVIHSYLEKSSTLSKKKVQCFSKLTLTDITNTSIDTVVTISVPIKMEYLSEDPIQPATSDFTPDISEAANYKPREIEAQPQQPVASIITKSGQPTLLDNLDVKVGISDQDINSSDNNTINSSYLTRLSDPDTDVMVDVSSEDEIDLLFKKPVKIKREFHDKFAKIKLSKKDLQRKRAELSMSPNYFTKTYKCETCILGFATEEQLTKHKDSYHDESRGRYVCAICSRRYRSQKRARVHATLHFNAYQCERCSQQYEVWNTDAFVRHYNEKHGFQECICKICHSQFKTIEKLRSHMRATHYQYKCDCGTIFSTQYFLRQHIKKKHSETKQETDKSLTESDGGHYCAICNKFYKDLATYRGHFNTVKKHQTDLSRYQCDDCGKKFHIKRYLEQHILYIHLKIKSEKCDLCSKKYSTRNGLRLHKINHHSSVVPIRDKVCDVCGAAFTTMAILNSHMVRHTGARPFACDECSATFGFSGAMYTHKKLVHKSKVKRRPQPQDHVEET